VSELAPYTYDLQDPSTWRNFPAPPREEWFERELRKIGPPNRLGQPRHKLVWGDEEQVFVKAEPSDDFKTGWYLKHHRCFVQRHKGFRFRDPQTRKRRVVARLDEIPDGVSFFTPVYEREECGIPRWIVERWFDEGDLGGAIGKGAYYPVLVIQEEPIDPVTNLGPYRPPGEDTLEQLRAMWQFGEKSDAEQDALVDAQRAEENALRERARVALWEDAPEAWQKIIRDNHLS
jgi:hypothetical protein